MSSPQSPISRLPGPLTENWEWQIQAACRGSDTTVFFHPDGERGDRRRTRERNAKALCARCPVIAECRAHALAVREPYGTWGGLSETERARLLGVRLAG